MATNKTIEERAAELLAFAKRAKRSCRTWHDLHNRIYGVGGELVRLFPSESERIAYSKTPEFEEISKLISSVGGDHGDANFSDVRGKANGKILVRVPKSIHARLLLEAEAEGISLNQLCGSKLAVDLAAKMQ